MTRFLEGPTPSLMVAIDISVNHIFHVTAPALCLSENIFGWFYFCYLNVLVLDLLLILYIAKPGELKPHNSENSLKNIAATLQGTCKYSYI